MSSLSDESSCFGSLSNGEAFLPEEICNKMSAEDLNNVFKNKHYFVKEELRTLAISGVQITVNAKFNGNGNYVLVEEKEPVVQIIT